MHETRDELESLQRLLDDSYARAGKHLRSIHTGERRLTAARLCELATRVCILDLATVSSRDEPRVAPVDGLLFHARFVFGSSPESLLARHLRRNQAVSAAYTRGEELTVLAHGSAVPIDCADPAEAPLHDFFREIYGPDYDSWGFWGKAGFWRLEPRAMFAAAFKPV